jgi:hypothetical protein
MSEASVPAQGEIISDKLVALAGNEHHNVDAGSPGDHWYRLWQLAATSVPVLEWRGPVAFARAYRAVPGIDHDFGRCWGSNDDQRVSLRLEDGDETGLLYVYDPTWDEYAVIGTDVPLAAVKNAFAAALPIGEHAAVEDFLALLPHVSAARPSAGPEL